MNYSYRKEYHGDWKRYGGESTCPGELIFWEERGYDLFDDIEVGAKKYLRCRLLTQIVFFGG
jgi:hypothetical protein